MPATMTRAEISDLAAALTADIEILDDRPTVRDRVSLATGVLVSVSTMDGIDTVVVPDPYAEAKASDPPDAADAPASEAQSGAVADSDFSSSAQHGS